MVREVVCLGLGLGSVDRWGRGWGGRWGKEVRRGGSRGERGET